MSEAELRIKHISYKIAGKRDAFWYNFLEGFGRAAGWGVVIGIAAMAIHYLGDNDVNTVPIETVAE